MRNSSTRIYRNRNKSSVREPCPPGPAQLDSTRHGPHRAHGYLQWCCVRHGSSAAARFVALPLTTRESVRILEPPFSLHRSHFSMILPPGTGYEKKIFSWRLGWFRGGVRKFPVFRLVDVCLVCLAPLLLPNYCLSHASTPDRVQVGLALSFAGHQAVHAPPFALQSSTPGP